MHLLIDLSSLYSLLSRTLKTKVTVLAGREYVPVQGLSFRAVRSKKKVGIHRIEIN